MKNFLVHNEDTKREMLNEIGLTKIEELFKQIPEKVRVGNFDISKPLSEAQLQREIRRLAKKNETDKINFCGGGVYNKFIPACVGQVAQRFEFLTAYTPYQAEISQGTLQIMYEFQTMMSRLTGMDTANATVYDGGTACAEAVLMSARISKKNRALVNKNINPEYLEVIKTYCRAGGVEVEVFEELPANTGDFACVLYQVPNYFGEIAYPKKLDDTLLVVCADLSTLSILKPPSEYGADIVVADVQSLGVPMSFGGPHAGIIATKEKYMRQLVGRLAGKTVDKDGNTAYTLTIQTREQHIKREKATGNICSNQALIGLWVTLYLSLLGEKGFRQAGYLSAKTAHSLADGLKKKGYKILNKNFFNEFLLEVNDADEFLSKLDGVGILGGIKVSESGVLVAATELITEEDVELYLSAV